jgi:hypothetical protein
MFQIFHALCFALHGISYAQLRLTVQQAVQLSDLADVLHAQRAAEAQFLTIPTFCIMVVQLGRD